MPEPTIATKQIIEQIFDDVAASYDCIGPSIFAQFGAHLVDHLPLAPHMHVLDIATGTGAVLLPAARRVWPEGRAIGIDLSSVTLQEAERAVRAEGLTNVELRKMDAEHLEFPDQSFDVVACAFSLFMFPDMEAALREMYRVLKPSGCLAIANFNKFDSAWTILMEQFMTYQIGVRPPQPITYTPHEMETLLSRFGFRSIKIHSEITDLVYGSAEDWWAFLLSLLTRATIMSMDEEMRTRFKDEYFAKLSPMFQPDGLHIYLAIIYALAKR